MIILALLVHTRSELTCKLSEKRESHSNGTDFRGEDFRDIDIHGGIAAGSARDVDVSIARN